MGVRCVFGIFALLLYTPLAADLNQLVVYKISLWLWPLTAAWLPILNALARTGEKSEGVGSVTFYLAVVGLFTTWSAGQLAWSMCY